MSWRHPPAPSVLLPAASSSEPHEQEVAVAHLTGDVVHGRLATKLLAMSEQDPHFRPVLEIARSPREQIDWEAVRAQVVEAPFGADCFTLVERLRILPDSVGAVA